jgi:hypothetical protein
MQSLTLMMIYLAWKELPLQCNWPSLQHKKKLKIRIRNVQDVYHASTDRDTFDKLLEQLAI